MKVLMSILILLAVLFTAWKLFDYWDKLDAQKEALEQAEKKAANIDPRQLGGMAQDMEKSLDQAYQSGPRALKEWIDKNKANKKIQDPRLAWVELDYVVKISQEDPVSARKVFADVKARTQTDSPVYRRVKELEKTYE